MEQQVWHQFYDPEVASSLDYPETTLYELFEKAVQESPGRTAALFFGARISYRKLGQLVDQFAAALASLGVKPEDRVALILPNLPVYPVAHFAAMKLGAVLVPTNPLYVERELEYQLNDSGAETIVALDKLHRRISAVVPSTTVKRVIYASVQDFLPFPFNLAYKIKNRHEPLVEPSPDVYFYSKLLKKRFPVGEAHRARPGDTAIFLYTGGTTGISKGAVLTHRNLLVNVVQTRA